MTKNAARVLRTLAFERRKRYHPMRQMSQARLPPKKHVALALLEHSSVFIHLDPRNERVHVPAWFKRQAQLVLQIGLNMPIPIPDLNLDDEGISCTLSFNRSPHYCRLPWASVFALVGEDGRGMVWPDDVPPEVAAQGRKQQAEQQRAQLRAVESKPAVAEAPEAAPVAPAGADAPAVNPPPRAKARRGRRGVERDAPPAAAASPAGGARRKRARKASPSPSKAADAPKLSVVGTPSEPSDAAERAAAPDGGKKKRELPPYLRVVK
jgi:stringent starvation protein B